VIDASHTKRLAAIGVEAAAERPAGHGAVWSPKRATTVLTATPPPTPTSTAEIGTAIAVASPAADDVARPPGSSPRVRRTFRLASAARSKPHIERRFSMPWGRPVGQMLTSSTGAVGDLGVVGQR